MAKSTKCAEKKERLIATCKNKKFKKPVKVSSDWGQYLIKSMALYTNATISERTKETLSLSIPLTIKMGRKSDTVNMQVQFGPEDFGVAPALKEKMTNLELGKQMFAMLCDYLSNIIGTEDGKRFRETKNNAIITTYGDKYVWKDGKGEVVDATVKPKKKTGTKV